MKQGAPFPGSFAAQDPGTIHDDVQAVEAPGYDCLSMDEILLNDNFREIFLLPSLEGQSGTTSLQASLEALAEFD
jgi:hypothetical protein